MFNAYDVKDKNFDNDNMEYLNPRCVNDVDNGDVVALYEFVGLRKVSRTTTFTETANVTA